MITRWLVHGGGACRTNQELTRRYWESRGNLSMDYVKQQLKWSSGIDEVLSNVNSEAVNDMCLVNLPAKGINGRRQGILLCHATECRTRLGGFCR